MGDNRGEHRESLRIHYRYSGNIRLVIGFAMSHRFVAPNVMDVKHPGV